MRICRHGVGFSLVEVVVALAILIILLPLATPLYDQFVKDAREEALRQRLTQMRRALRLFYQDQGRYPNMLFDQFGNQVDVLDPQYSELVQGIHDGTSGHYPPNRRLYLANLPEDPFSGRADWGLVRADAVPSGLASKHPMPTSTSTRQLSARRRGITSGTIQMLDNIQPIRGLVQVMDVKSRTPGFEDY